MKAVAESLFAEFEAAALEDWIEAARASLPGRRLESLVSPTYEGIDIQPLMSADGVGAAHGDALPGQYPYRRGATAAGYRARPWLIAQDIDIADPGEFNKALLDALANGQTAVTLGDTLQLKDAGDLRSALAVIDLRRYPILVGSDARAPEIYQLLRAALSADNLAQLTGCVAYDPLADLAQTGVMPADAFARLTAHVQSVAEHSPLLNSIGVSAAVYHNAGANAVQELALTLATAVAYLRSLSERGHDLDSVAEKLYVELGIGENFFMVVAKFRAVRLLWAQMLRAFDIDAAGQRIRLHARSGTRNKMRRDRQVNLLRLTTEALAAAIGGVDSLTLAPLDQALGESDAFTRRLSRNVQLILQEEAQLTQVIDPAGGAAHVERLTDELARRSWAQFQAIEAAGGMLAALESGAIQAEIAAIAEKRQGDVATDETVLVGFNAYIFPDEVLPAQKEAPTVTSAHASDRVVQIQPLTPIDLAESAKAEDGL